RADNSFHIQRSSNEAKTRHDPGDDGAPEQLLAGQDRPVHELPIGGVVVNPISNRKGERGIALLVTVFALLLLTGHTLGMTVSPTTEPTINPNYREKQTATFAVMAGLQEARDRLQPATHNIPAPTDLPSLAAANVIYIINPKSGETVEPW